MSLAEAITDGLGGLHGPLSPRTLLTRGFAPFWQVYVVGLVQITSPWMYSLGHRLYKDTGYFILAS